MGLGLSVSANLVARYGGEIRLMPRMTGDSERTSWWSYHSDPPVAGYSRGMTSATGLIVDDLSCSASRW